MGNAKIPPGGAEAEHENRLSANVTDRPGPTGVIWDASTLTRMVGDNPGTLRRLLDKFLLVSAEHVTTVKAAVAAGDLKTVAEVAHKMKSAARTVGASELGELCQRLEMSGRAEDKNEVNLLSEKLEISFQEVAEQIRNSL